LVPNAAAHNVCSRANLDSDLAASVLDFAALLACLKAVFDPSTYKTHVTTALLEENQTDLKVMNDRGESLPFAVAVKLALAGVP
jgi:hypothetical protein